MLSASRLTGLVLSVPDVVAAAAFYQTAFGARRLAGADRLAAGGVELRLRAAASPRTAGGDLVFLTGDVGRAARALERRGVRPGAAHRNPLGEAVGLRDPGGRRLWVFQPSAATLRGPAGPLIRDVRLAFGDGDGDGLPLLAVAVPESDGGASRELYYSGLGLALLARGRSADAYDAGWVLLLTRRVRTVRCDDIACVYEVADAAGLCARLSGPRRAEHGAPGPSGPVIWPTDPAAPACYLCEGGRNDEPALPAVRW
jgi:hypothetical protein